MIHASFACDHVVFVSVWFYIKMWAGGLCYDYHSLHKNESFHSRSCFVNVTIIYLSALTDRSSHWSMKLNDMKRATSSFLFHNPFAFIKMERNQTAIWEYFLSPFFLCLIINPTKIVSFENATKNLTSRKSSFFWKSINFHGILKVINMNRRHACLFSCRGMFSLLFYCVSSAPKILISGLS